MCMWYFAWVGGWHRIPSLFRNKIGIFGGCWGVFRFSCLHSRWRHEIICSIRCNAHIESLLFYFIFKDTRSFALVFDGFLVNRTGFTPPPIIILNKPTEKTISLKIYINITCFTICWHYWMALASLRSLFNLSNHGRVEKNSTQLNPNSSRGSNPTHLDWVGHMGWIVFFFNWALEQHQTNKSKIIT